MILVAVGGNLGSGAGVAPRVACDAGVEALRALPGLRVQAVSRWYATVPVPASDQPDYVNGMVRLEGAADPAELLTWLHRIEAAAGRARSVRNAARALDLDIVDLHGLIRAAPDPVLPHPRAHLRRFVLVPLREVAPDWVHPVLGLDAGGLLAGLPDDGGVRLLQG